MSERQVTVENGKYTFVLKPGEYRVHVLRHGSPWLVIEQGCNAVWALVAEMVDARLLIDSVRRWATVGDGGFQHGELHAAFRAYCDERGEKKPPKPEANTAPANTVSKVKRWCFGKMHALIAEFGLEEGVKLYEEALFGRAEDPDGRPMFPVRDEPVADEVCTASDGDAAHPLGDVDGVQSSAPSEPSLGRGVVCEPRWQTAGRVSAASDVDEPSCRDTGCQRESGHEGLHMSRTWDAGNTDEIVEEWADDGHGPADPEDRLVALLARFADEDVKNAIRVAFGMGREVRS